MKARWTPESKMDTTSKVTPISIFDPYMKNISKTQAIAILLFEYIAIVSLGIIAVTVLAGGFSLPFGPVMIKSHNLKNPLIVLFSALVIRRLLTGNFFKNWRCLERVRQIGKKPYTTSDKLLGILLVLLLIMGLITLLNPLQRGLKGFYYSNAQRTGSPFITAIDRSLDLKRLERLFPPITQNYSIQWTGAILIPATGDYRFTTLSKDASELYINDQLVVDNGGEHDFQEQTGSIHLEKGIYPLKIFYNYLEGPKGAGFKAFWKRPGKSRRTLSQSHLFSELPSKTAFFAGQGLEMLFALCKGLCLVWIILVVLIAAGKFSLLPYPVKRAFVVTFIFLIVLIAHFFWSTIYTGFDSGLSVYTSMSLIKEGNVNLDEYRGLLIEGDRRVQSVGAHLHNFFPIGTSLLSVPHMFVIDQFLTKSLNIDIIQVMEGNIEVFVACTIVAFTSVLIFLIGNLLLKNLSYSTLLALTFAFCTSAWSTASRALWQHGPTMMLLALCLYLLLLAQHKPEYEPWLIRLVAIPLAFSYVVRPTNSISIVVITGFIFLRHRKHFLSYCLWSMLVAIPFFLFNLKAYHFLLSPYYLPNRLGSNPYFFEALAGNLISPARGLFIFTPVLLFSIYGIVLKIKKKQMGALDYALLMIIGLHWIAISTFNPWCAGHSYGPRFFSDMIPYFIYFLIPVLANIPSLQGIRKTGLLAVLWCTIVLSCLIHYQGATCWEVYLWNLGPPTVEEKLWNWHDLQFLQGL